MTTRTRLWVLLVSTPVMAFALVGGYLGQAMAKDGTFQHLRVFEDVVSLVVNNYVEEVDVKEAMQGALKGLAEGLDPDSAYLTPDLVKAVEANSVAGPADVGVVLIRQYYLRVVSTRDGSPAARAGLADRRLHPRHRRQADAQHVGLRGRAAAAGSRRQPREAAGLPRQRGRTARRRADARAADRRRGDLAHGQPHHRLRAGGRVLQGHAARAASRPSTRWPRPGASRYVVDLRGTANGDLDDGIAAARLFVKTRHAGRAAPARRSRKSVAAADADGAIAAPVALLVEPGHVRGGGGVRRGARRQRSRRSDRRAHARPRRAPAAREAARRQRPADLQPALPDAEERAASRARAAARRGGRRARRRVRRRSRPPGDKALDAAVARLAPRPPRRRRREPAGTDAVAKARRQAAPRRRRDQAHQSLQGDSTLRPPPADVQESIGPRPAHGFVILSVRVKA